MSAALETYLAEVEAAEGRMTGGEWIAADDELHEAWSVRANGMYVCATRTEKPIGGSSDIGQPDAHGIALLRNRVKALCGMVRENIQELELAQLNHKLAMNIQDLFIKANPGAVLTVPGTDDICALAKNQEAKP